ncbi:MAG: bifunctional protein-disulfide isomerase/oxidoreductase DsbC [Alteromonadaceae bacterium]|nr:bifunctional protein-disulfide isomerase/oxidoreductase DsbC [Alteromonadaceae bacterium]
MFNKCSVIIFTLLFSCSTFVFAWEKEAASSTGIQTFNAKQITTKLTSLLGMEIKSVRITPMAGLAEVVTSQGLFYTSFDGQFFIEGTLYGLGEKVSNLTENTLARVRVEGLKEFEKDMIVYPAKDEKHVINVFTDITCGYCRKMHQQIDAYNDLGITVRYLAYPRAGIKDRTGSFTPGFKDLRSIWCHDDPQTALTKAKSGSSVELRVCDKPVAEEFNFGRQVGVNSTPTVITSNGTLMPGYRKPQELLKILENM